MRSNTTFAALCVLMVPVIIAVPTQKASSSDPAVLDEHAVADLPVAHPRLEVLADSPPHAVSVPACTGDINGNGTVDGADILMLLSAWGKCNDPNQCPADLNGDTVVDGQDLLILLSVWGECPEPTADCRFDSGPTSFLHLGWIDGGVMGWAHRFTSDCPKDGIIRNIGTTYGTVQTDCMPPGATPVGYAIMTDTGNGPGNVIWSGQATIDCASITTDIFQQLPVPDVAIDGMETFFAYVWVWQPPSSGLPAPMDTTVYNADEHVGNVWVIGTPGAPDFDSYDPEKPAFVERVEDVGFSGVWMLRVNQENQDPSS